MEAEEIQNAIELDSYLALARGEVAQLLYSFLLGAAEHIAKRQHPPEELIANLENKIHEILLASYLLGYLHIKEKVEEDFNLVDFSYSYVVQELLERVEVTPEEFQRLNDATRVASFTVSRLTAYDAIEKVKEKLLRAIPEGWTIRRFLEEVGADEVIRVAGFHATNPWYWETVFRTNVQSAYNAGRMRAIEKYAEHIPYLEYVAILDERTTEICKEYDGIIRPVTDPIWKTIAPPNHFNCRSVIRPVTRYEAEQGIKLTPEEALKELPEPQEGFRSAPYSNWTMFDIPEDLAERLAKYGLLEAAQKVARRARQSNAAITNQALKKRMMDKGTARKVFGEGIVSHVDNVRWRPQLKGAAGYYKYNYATSEARIEFSSSSIKSGWEVIQLLEKGVISPDDLTDRQKYELLSAIQVFAHEFTHSASNIADKKAYLIKIFQGYRQNGYGPLIESFTDVTAAVFREKFCEAMGWTNTLKVLQSKALKDVYTFGYRPIVTPVWDMIQDITKAQNITAREYVGKMVGYSQYAPERLLGRLCLNYIRAKHKKLARRIEQIIQKYGDNIEEYVFDVLPGDIHFAVKNLDGKLFGSFKEMLDREDVAEDIINDLAGNLRALES